MADTRGSECGLLNQELTARQKADGGWGAKRDGVSNSECTALAILVLRTASETDGSAARSGVQWLLDRQDPVGAWSYSEQTPFTPWPTPIVLLSLRGAQDSDPVVRRGIDWLMSTRGVQPGLLMRIRQLLFDDEPAELDQMLDGWPWVPDTFAWVEPTSWALIALKAEWQGDRPRAVRARIADGEALLLDRSCVGGGWNYGNRTVLGEDLPAYPDTTALALMALRGRTSPVVDESFAVLDSLLEEHASVLSLSLAILGRRCWHRPAEDLVSRLASRCAEAGEWDTRSLALAALSLAPRLDWLENTFDA